ncbi:DUF1343 domain-containing protein [Chlorobium sp. N1]|uniref:exo-beta-N-acetylmuramidase NamZ family protein n=1 Tax=Chlorobium sp. N1 TaxID=2491138 RepID=UPI00103E0BF2|nr:DUF1343 domain-containing protein [Chlorobium sp. N1]TCD47178.1 DUF1343 domain-containing protein [Chlorobium sp. N1]
MENRLFCVGWFPPALLLLLSLLFLSLPAPLSAAGRPPVADSCRFSTGLDRLEREGCGELLGMRVGLVTNLAARTRSGEAGYAMMLRHGVRLRWLMAPEHGFRVDVGAGKAAGGTLLGDSLRVHSLYGATKTPDLRLLRQVDIVVFDLQDVGVRCYTYLSTMKNVMLACRRTGTPFMVLDRPNPIAPLGRGGFMLEPSRASFVGAENVPFVHRMTLGELALLIRRRHAPELDLRVVTMQGWRRERFGDELPGFRFRSPSPNISDMETAVAYPATVLIEATAFSEGRGTSRPFLQFGAPFADGRALARTLNASGLQGVRFREASFTPSSGKWAGERCRGVRLSITDRSLFDPFATQVAILHALHSSYPRRLGIRSGFFDRLAGTDRLRLMLLSGETRASITAAAGRDREAFSPALLY